MSGATYRSVIVYIIISSHLSPLTSEVFEAPQMTLQQYLSILPCLPLPSGNLQTPFLNGVFPSLLCLPLLLAPFTVPCRIVFAMPEDHETWPYHLSFRFFTMVRRSSCTPIAFWILLRTFSLVTCLCRKCSEVSYSISSQGLLDSSLDFCCQGPALTSIKEGG